MSMRPFFLKKGPWKRRSLVEVNLWPDQLSIIKGVGECSCNLGATERPRGPGQIKGGDTSAVSSGGEISRSQGHVTS